MNREVIVVCRDICHRDMRTLGFLLHKTFCRDGCMVLPLPIKMREVLA